MKSKLYQMTMLDKDMPTDPIDTFVLAAGSDYRAYEVLRKLEKAGTVVKDSFLFDFKERLAQIELGDPYYDYQNLKMGEITRIPCALQEPKSCLGVLLANESRIVDRSVAIDVSCFTKPYFFYLLRLFKERLKLGSIHVYYTEPKSYLFPGAVFSSFHSTLGPLKILEIPGFSGVEQRGSVRILVILIGFEGDLSREINEDVSPYETVAVNGFPGYAPKFKDISLIANGELINDNNVILAYSRANNPFEVYNLLSRIHSKHQNCFMNIAPLGTKPMALGACLFALHNSDIRVVYPFPESYEKTTTDMCWNSWRYEIPLSAEPIS